MKIHNIRKKAAELFPFLFRISQRIRFFLLSRKTPDEVFTTFYRKNHWRNPESVSGLGSTLKETEILRKKLPTLLNNLVIDSMLDLPCGDFNWMKECNLPIKRYLGGDIVNDIVELNNEKYKNDIISFHKLNLISDQLPKTDLLFCRDCLVHLSFLNIKEAFENIKKHHFKYVMLTTFPNYDKNVDIVTGRWRPLNFEKAPFNMPKPIYILDEDNVQNEMKKCMGIWKLEDIKFSDQTISD